MGSRAASTLIGLLLVTLTATAQPPPLPDTSVGKVFADWLAVSNSGDEARIGAFKDRYDLKQSVDDVLRQEDSSGGFELLQVEKSSDHNLRALLKEKDSDQVVDWDMTLTGTEPVKIESLNGWERDRGVSGAFYPVRMSEAAALSALRQRADERAKEDRFSGALLIARHGKVLLENTWGLADRATGKRVTAATRFHLGSMNKMFTGVAILQLIAAGKVSLEGTVGTYLPDYPNKDVAGKVTVRELLNHTGGTGDIFGPQFAANRNTLRAHSDYLKLYGERGLDHEPGGTDRYSNYGYVLLGAIIERVSGLSYYDYVDEHIFKPAGMRATGSPPESEVVPGRAVGYMRVHHAWVDAKDTLFFRGMAAGDGLSTVGDLLKFAQALQAGKLVPRQWLEEATKPQNNQHWYGYGFMVSGEGPLRRYGHEGGAPGRNGDLWIYPELGVVIVGLSNLDPPASDRLTYFYSLRMPLSR